MNSIEILEKNQEIMSLARNTFYGYRYAPEPTVTFVHKGRYAGMAHGSMKLTYNLAILAQFSDHDVIDTISHEIAHLICAFTGLGKNHDNGWKRVHRMLGGNGQRCYKGADIIVPYGRHRKRYQYRADCGTVLWVSDVIHNKIMNGRTRILIATRGKITAIGFMGNVK